MKQSREKILVVGLIGVFVFYWYGLTFVKDVLFGPITGRYATIKRLEADNVKKSGDVKKILAAQKDLKAWEKQSLPPEPTVAVELYREWLTKLAEKNKLTSVSVVPSRVEPKPKGDIYHVVPMTIKAQAKKEPLCNFLYEFYQAGLLHKVVKMTVDSTKRENNPTLTVMIAVEGLSLVNSPKRLDTLFADPENPAPSLVADKLKEQTEYAAITKKNLFVRGYDGPTPPRVVRTEAPAPPAPDVAEHVYLVGRVAVNNRYEGWLYDRMNNQQTTLTEGSSFSIGGMQGKVIAIDNDSVTLQINTDTFKLELGQNLKQMQKIATAAPAVAPTTPVTEEAPAATTKPVENPPPASTPSTG